MPTLKCRAKQLSGKIRLKDKFWNERMEKWIKSPEDPNFIILEIKADTIRLMNDNGEPETLNL
jgi:general stress protein 26